MGQTWPTSDTPILYTYWNVTKQMMFAIYDIHVSNLTLKGPDKLAYENVVCSSRLLHIYLLISLGNVNMYAISRDTDQTTPIGVV